MEDKQLTSEIKEFLDSKGIYNTKEQLEQWYNFAKYQTEQDTYWFPCENCDNPSCTYKEGFPIWFCSDQQ
ncbi:MAG TPA: hypothetical protein VIM42_09225 [Clostridium sp.]